MTQFLTRMPDWAQPIAGLRLPGWIAPYVVVVAAVLVALLIHQIVLAVLRRIGRRIEWTTGRKLSGRLTGPTRWLLVTFALSVARPTLGLSGEARAVWDQVAGLLVPALFGWLAIGVIRVLNDIVQERADVSVADNLAARRRRTRAGIFYRIAIFVVLLITLCMMLMSIPAVRAVGVTIAASAGLAALAVGAAAQPALKNLIAGVQMALTEPIRIDDVVIIEGEWGRIEEIRMTFVVVKIWDERRLVVPVSKFLEDSFQNWTRQTSELLGSVFWHLDPSADIDRIRAKVGELVEGNARWDKRFWNVQVTEMGTDTMEVRALMTAKDASTTFDLRCDVREGLLKFLREEMPEAILRRRGELAISSPTGASAPADPPPARPT